MIVAALASVIMLTGLLIVFGTYYSASVPLPTSLALPQATRITYSNGVVMAQIGSVTRFQVNSDQISDKVKKAVVATEDATFYTNSGIDFKGILRAIVNNVTGGSTQGASTITQQYARQAMALTQDASYSRKLKEAAIAIKMTRDWPKDQILTAYLNTVPFGRGAYGIEAASQAYFHKTNMALTWNEAMVLVDLIKDPNGGEYDPYHPCANSKGMCPNDTAEARFEYTRGQMVKLGYITTAQAASPDFTYPQTAVSPKLLADGQSLSSPVGFIVRQVMSELILSKDRKTGQPWVLPGTNTPAFSELALENGGYTITTTINKQAEDAAIGAADFKKTTSPGYHTVPQGTDGELVSIAPQTGRVIAYYGGDDGTGLDYAGISLNLNLNLDPNAPASPASSAVGDDAIKALGLAGAHRDPGSSMKTITMAAALSAGYGLDSYWNGPPKLPRPGESLLTNSLADSCPNQPDACTMAEGLKRSTNTMYYGIAKKVGVGNVIQMAQRLGINHIWDTSNKRYDLTATNGIDVEHQGQFGPDLGFGQVGTDLYDLAHAISTIANNGKVTTAHFVRNVVIPNQPNFHFQEPLTSTQVQDFQVEKAHDEQWAMSQIMTRSDEVSSPWAIHTGHTNLLEGGRPSAGKTGTWELSPSDSRDNSVSAFSGYTAPGDGQLSTSVWVGSTGKVTQPLIILDAKTGKPILSGGRTQILSGSRMAAPIWTQYMDAALKVSVETGQGTNLKFSAAPIMQFAGRDNTGDKPGDGVSPSPSAPPSGPATTLPGGPTTLPIPQNLQANVTGDNSIQLNWDALPGLHYRVYRGSLALGQQNPGFTDNGLDPGTLYVYTVTAYDDLGDTSPVAQTQATTTGQSPPQQAPLSPPGNIAADNSQAGQITVTWQPAQGANGYEIYVQRGNGQLVDDKTVNGGNTTTLTFQSTAGLHYSIRIRSNGPSNQQSAWSNWTNVNGM
jgi:membrane peptidoglycan carboxypeptidase